MQPGSNWLTRRSFPSLTSGSRMPDSYHGIGATVGSVIRTKGAITRAAVGVDTGRDSVPYGANNQAN